MNINKKRTNSWSVTRFVDILNKSVGAHLGISNLEEIVSIKVINNTVVVEIQPKVSRRGR